MIGTANALFLLQMMSERDLHLCFIDYDKAFDTVKQQEMLWMLARMRIDEKDERIIRK